MTLAKVFFENLMLEFLRFHTWCIGQCETQGEIDTLDNIFLPIFYYLEKRSMTIYLYLAFRDNQGLTQIMKRKINTKVGKNWCRSYPELNTIWS